MSQLFRLRSYYARIQLLKNYKAGRFWVTKNLRTTLVSIFPLVQIHANVGERIPTLQISIVEMTLHLLTISLYTIVPWREFIPSLYYAWFVLLDLNIVLISLRLPGFASYCIFWSPQQKIILAQSSQKCQRSSSSPIVSPYPTLPLITTFLDHLGCNTSCFL